MLVVWRDMSTVFDSMRSSGRDNMATLMASSALRVTGDRVRDGSDGADSSSARRMSVSIGRPIIWQSSMRESVRPSFTCCRVISASFTFTLTLSPSLRVATPSAIIF